MFAATTPENTPMAYRTSTSANPNPMISPAFIEANYEALESLLRGRHRQMRNNDLQTELEIRRWWETIVGFERAQSRGERRVERNTEGGRPLEETPKGNGGQSVNLPPLLAAHLGKGKNGQPLQSSLTFAYGGQALPNNIGGNFPPNGIVLNPVGSVTTFVRWIEDYPLLDGQKMPSHIGSYYGKGDPDNFLHLFKGVIRIQKWLMPILGLHEEQRISGFVHGLTTRSLVEHFSTDLPSTYKGLMEKTYTWVEAREVATNGASRDRIDSFERSKKSSWDNNRGQQNNHGLLPSLSKSLKEILATEKAARSFEPPPKIFGRIPRTIMVEGKPFNTEHKLYKYSHVKPIKQNKRGLGPDRNMAACKEIEELTKAGILQKVKHQAWVANPVMIDWKIESLSRFRLKCFLDAYKGYHQIQMVEEDKNKTAFYAEEGVFCYKKIPFGLKNARATYQRSGAGLMLIDPEGKEYIYALRFEFETTNNKAEYEALLAAKQTSIKDYLQKVKAALRGFEEYKVERVHRNQNMKADTLSKLASMTFEHLTKEVLVEVLTKRRTLYWRSSSQSKVESSIVIGNIHESSCASEGSYGRAVGDLGVLSMEVDVPLLMCFEGAIRALGCLIFIFGKLWKSDALVDAMGGFIVVIMDEEMVK
ncbi:hypothetical protein Tco_0038375 [Tanacetum coccineum]